jgi:tRNA G18 (ribose-2'-O)-methylase SpoU
LDGHPFGTRCPACLGSTQAVSSHPLRTESLPPFDGPSIQLEALLDNIRSAWNVGSIFRTADGFGLARLHLCGITPTPESDAVRKTSLGAEESVAWTYHKDAVILVKRLKVEGWKVIALEEDERAREIKDERRKMKNEWGKMILVVGNEVTGVDPELLDLCDEIVYIPMRGRKKSFNASVAFGIAVYALGDAG